jgi:hypothetical protein
MKKALVLSLAAVLGLGFASFAQTLSGSWDTSIIIEPATPTIDIESTLIVTYTVSGWSFTSTTSVDGTGWTQQDFDVTGSLGAFSIGSSLVFDPVLVAFDSWEVTGGLSLAGVTFDGTFTLVPNGTQIVIEASGSAGSVDVGVELTLGDLVGCDFDFSSVVITVDNKVLVLTPAFDFGATACFDIYLSTPTEIFGNVTVNGIGLECEIGGVSFTGISWLGDINAVKPGLLKGTPYWEAYQIATTDDGCCGPFNFEITIYFDHGAELFDVAELDAAFDIQISSQFTFGMSIQYLMATGFAEWSLDFMVEW